MVKYVPQNNDDNTVTGTEIDDEKLDHVIYKKKLHTQKSKTNRFQQKFSKEEDLENFLSSNEETITTEEYFKQVHDFFKNQNKKNPQTNYRKKEYIYEKVCEVCDDIKNDHLMLLCDYCDDAYHTYCLEPKLESVPEDDVWICPICLSDKHEKEFKEKVTLKKMENNRASTSSSSQVKNKRQTVLEEHYEVLKSDKDINRVIFFFLIEVRNF